MSLSRDRDKRPVVLVLLGCFSRGVEATGPNQSLLGMVKALPEYRFRVVGEAVPGDSPGEWTELAGVEQLPLETRRVGTRGLLKVLRDTPHDLVIANSFFDLQFTQPLLYMRRFGMVPATPVLLAPRGEFSSGALSIRGSRKTAYLRLAERLGLLREVALQATSPHEADDIRKGLFFAKQVLVGPNVREVPALPQHCPRLAGEPLRVGLVGRILPMKNVHFALDLLTRVDFPVRVNLFGPIEDQAYWAECQERIARLPDQVSVVHHGAIPRSEVIPRLAEQDLLLHPSLGENFGHAIADALIAGTPVLLSNRTPWRDLQAIRAGWDLPLEEPNLFVTALRHMANASPSALLEQRQRVRSFAEARLDPHAAARQLAECIAAAMKRPDQQAAPCA